MGQPGTNPWQEWVWHLKSSEKAVVFGALLVMELRAQYEAREVVGAHRVELHEERGS